MKEQTAIKLFSITAVAFMMVCALGVIITESEEADAASVYTITFDAPGGDGINHAEYKFESGTTIQLPVTTFSRTDHMIEFWEDSDGTRFTPGQDWTITRNDTLTAVYKATNGNHISEQDAIVELGGRYEKNMDTLSNETPVGGSFQLRATTNLADTEIIDGAPRSISTVRYSIEDIYFGANAPENRTKEVKIVGHIPLQPDTALGYNYELSDGSVRALIYNNAVLFVDARYDSALREYMEKLYDEQSKIREREAVESVSKF